MTSHQGNNVYFFHRSYSWRICSVISSSSIICGFIFHRRQSLGRFATLTRFIPKPATAMPTVDTSSPWCLYFASPLISLSIDCTQSLLISLINTCLLMPSICIMVTFCSGIRSVLWIHSWMSNAVIFRLAGSKLHTVVLSRSAIMYQHFTSSYHHSQFLTNHAKTLRNSLQQVDLRAPITTFPVRSA